MDHLCGFLSCVCFAYAVTCWERADLLALVCMSNCEFATPIGILGQVRYLIVSIRDLCTLTYFYQEDN